jgi:pantothenate kinase
MDAGQADDARLSPFVRFSREEWGRLRVPTSLSLPETDLCNLGRLSEQLSLEEATEVYLPQVPRHLSQKLNHQSLGSEPC